MAETDGPGPSVYEFGPYRAKVFDTLVELVTRAGSLVTREELIEAVWPDTVVEESNLSHNISALRKALEHAESPAIETVPKRGYRFVGDVRVVEESAATPHYRDPVVKVPAEEEPDPLSQEIRFCLTRDGVQLAYSTVGEGPPLVKTANWLNHLEFDFESPIWRHVIRAMAEDHTLIRYDERGNGLSDWNVSELSIDRFVDDLETVVDAMGLDRFPLLGISQGCAVAIAYAVRHPERVTHLVLHGGYPVGWRLRDTPEDVERREALGTLILQGWGLENPALSRRTGSTTCSASRPRPRTRCASGRPWAPSTSATSYPRSAPPPSSCTPNTRAWCPSSTAAGWPATSRARASCRSRAVAT
jgi:DNA-binding winged helix-turn-helix (wHTH) protein